jgi:alkylation response protein AidB-like acyl-CoA dehydrogenase
MPLFLDDEQTLLQDTARGFVETAAPVSHLRALRDADDPRGWSAEVWAAFADMGFPGILIAEDQGGLGLGAVEAGIVLEQIGRNLTPSPFLSTAVGAAVALSDAGEELMRRWLPGLANGSLTAALAIDEGVCHRPERIAMSAKREGEGFALSGEKRLVVGGHIADLLIVAARTSGTPGSTEGLTLFAIQRDQPGLSATTDRLADSSLSSRIVFEDLTVGADAVIGEVDGGWSVLGLVLDHLRTGAAAELAGVASAAMDRTFGYLRERVQFGQIIGTFQALQHRAAHLYAETEVAFAAVLKAQQLLDAGDPRAHAAAMVAKAQAGLVATLAVQEAVQMHGGIGMTDEHDIGLFMKRARVLGELYGDADDLADRLARLSAF